ncbi:MAG: NAD(P)-dependent oxidoreductase [Chloroflexota bacterium]
MERIIVTGGSGKAGRETVRNLQRHGYQVRNLDIAAPANTDVPTVVVDLTDYGATFAAMHGFDAVIHLAANPAPDQDHLTGADRFAHNTVSTFNVFQAAAHLGMSRVVWASSETVFGYPFDRTRPLALPVTEGMPPQPQSGYAMSKAVSEELARLMHARYGLTFVGLRFSNILDPSDYEAVPSYWPDPRARAWNLWAYIDVRDAAEACRLALEAPISGAEVVTIAAADSIMTTPNADLVHEVLGDVPLDPALGVTETLLSVRKARELLGWEPAHSWRETVTPRRD